MSARSRFDILVISDEHLFMQMGTTYEENEGNPPSNANMGYTYKAETGKHQKRLSWWSG
jgi:hypothetical protein